MDPAAPSAIPPLSAPVLARSDLPDLANFRDTNGHAVSFCERPDAAGCLILDLRLPGVSGLDFQEELAARKIDFPVVFVTGHGDIPMSVRAMKSGAVAFLTKPFREQELLEAIQHGIEQSRVVRRLNAEMRTLQQRYAFLTPREREVFPCVHRGQVMQKMKAESLAHLIHMAEKLGLGSN